MAESGCSMSLYESRLSAAQERCASTSNRNFEGRQDREDEPICIPSHASAAAIAGHFIDVRDISLLDKKEG